MTRNKEHQKLLDDILLAVGSLPSVRIWPRVVGFDESKQIRYGIPGECDLDGIMLGGRRISIEIKTGKATLSKDQKRWKAMILKFGGIYVEARSVDDALDGIKQALSGLL